MKRDLDAMSNRVHDVVIIGGGITGAMVAWDASLRGLSVALLEANDFGHATTAGSSKLIHGGLRYLKNLELGLIRESLKERRIWEIIAPHMVFPLEFVMPTKGFGTKSRWFTRLGLSIYDRLAFDRNWLSDEDKKIPAHRGLSTKALMALQPALTSEGIRGGVSYFDCQMVSPERLCLECVIGAAHNGAQTANYIKAAQFKYGIQNGMRAVNGVEAIDKFTGARYVIRGRMFVNAAGPWADLVQESANGGSAARNLVRSKGVHLITRNLTRNQAVAVQTENGHLFVLPWRGHSIIGTTDTVFKGDPEELCVTEDDIEFLLAQTNKAFSGLRLSRRDVLHAYAGLRPLVDTNPGDGKNSSYNASRKAEIVDHEDENLACFLSVIGGKWTTSRLIAERTVNLIGKRLNKSLRPCETHTTPLPGGEVGKFQSFKKRASQKFDFLEPNVCSNLVATYGSMAESVAALAGSSPKLRKSVDVRSSDIAAQVVHAVREEMAMTVDDIIFRRTGIGTLGHPGGDTVTRIARIMSSEFGWDAAETVRQVEATESQFINTLSPSEVL